MDVVMKQQAARYPRWILGQTREHLSEVDKPNPLIPSSLSHRANRLRLAQVGDASAFCCEALLGPL